MKYYFGYFLHFGQITAMTWAEESGVAVGGKPKNLIQKHQISQSEYNLTLRKLEEIYPRPILPLE